MMQVVWDPAKADSNLATHGVRFSEAATRLEDDLALTREDPDSGAEQRFVTLGMSALSNLLVVVYSYPGPDTILIISAWKANRRQRVRYEESSR